MKLRNVLAAQPANAGDVARHLELHESYIPDISRWEMLEHGYGIVDRPDASPRPYTIKIKRKLLGEGVSIPRQLAYYGLGYYSRRRDLQVGGILRLGVVEADTEKRCSIVVPSFTHEAIGEAVMDLMQGQTAFDQAERLLESGDVYSPNPGDPCDISGLSEWERRDFMNRAGLAMNEVNARLRSGRPPAWLSQIAG